MKLKEYEDNSDNIAHYYLRSEGAWSPLEAWLVEIIPRFRMRYVEQYHPQREEEYNLLSFPEEFKTSILTRK